MRKKKIDSRWKYNMKVHKKKKKKKNNFNKNKKKKKIKKILK